MLNILKNVNKIESYYIEKIYLNTILDFLFMILFPNNPEI